MFSEVIACLDGSPFAEKILPYACAVARPMGAKLRLLWVVENEADRATAKSYLQCLAGRWEAEPIVKLARTDAGGAIIEELRGAPSALPAITTRGRSPLAEALLGSVALDVIRGARRPVLLYRPRFEVAKAGRDLKLKWVVAALDGSEFSERIIPFAAGIARSLAAKLELVQVLPARDGGRSGSSAPGRDILESSYLHRQADWIQRAYALRADWEVLHGDPAAAICDHLRGRGDALLAMTSHARAALEQALFGSVAAECARRAGVPLLVYWPAP